MSALRVLNGKKLSHLIRTENRKEKKELFVGNSGTQEGENAAMDPKFREGKRTKSRDERRVRPFWRVRESSASQTTGFFRLEVKCAVPREDRSVIQ